jgi:hypothetical protein
MAEEIVLSGPRPNVETLLSELQKKFAGQNLSIGDPIQSQPAFFGREPHRLAEWVQVIITIGVAVAPVVTKEIVVWLKERSSKSRVAVLHRKKKRRRSKRS